MKEIRNVEAVHPLTSGQGHNEVYFQYFKQG
jgi:hypothetical protein